MGGRRLAIYDVCQRVFVMHMIRYGRFRLIPFIRDDGRWNMMAI